LCRSIFLYICLGWLYVIKDTESIFLSGLYCSYMCFAIYSHAHLSIPSKTSSFWYYNGFEEKYQKFQNSSMIIFSSEIRLKLKEFIGIARSINLCILTSFSDWYMISPYLILMSNDRSIKCRKNIFGFFYQRAIFAQVDGYTWILLFKGEYVLSNNLVIYFNRIKSQFSLMSIITYAYDYNKEWNHVKCLFITSNYSFNFEIDITSGTIDIFPAGKYSQKGEKRWFFAHILFNIVNHL